MDALNGPDSVRQQVVAAETEALVKGFKDTNIMAYYSTPQKVSYAHKMYKGSDKKGNGMSLFCLRDVAIAYFD